MQYKDKKQNNRKKESFFKKPLKKIQIHPNNLYKKPVKKVFAPDFQGRKEMPLCCIDAYNQIAQLYKTGKSIRTNKANSTASVRDEVQISQTARDYQIAKQAVAGASDVREDKVAQLKASMSSGNYSVETDSFANKLLEKYKAAMM